MGAPMAQLMDLKQEREKRERERRKSRRAMLSTAQDVRHTAVRSCYRAGSYREGLDRRLSKIPRRPSKLACSRAMKRSLRTQTAAHQRTKSDGKFEAEDCICLSSFYRRWPHPPVCRPHLFHLLVSAAIHPPTRRRQGNATV